MMPLKGKGVKPVVMPERGIGPMAPTVKAPVVAPVRGGVAGPVRGPVVTQPVRTSVAGPSRAIPVPMPVRAPVRVPPVVRPPERFQGLVNQLATRKNLAKPNVLATMAAKRRAGSY